MKSTKTYSLIILILLLFPQVACANTITASGLVGCHGLFLNILIGWLEGTLIAKIYKTKKLKTILLMIVANYVSAIAGFFMMASFKTWTSHIDLYNVKTVVITMWSIFFIATVLLEWPCILLLLRKQNHFIIRSLKASLLVQTISYACLVPIYLFLGAHGLILFTHPDSSLKFIKPTNVELFYIASEDSYIHRSSLSDAQSELFYDKIKLNNRYDRLYTEQNKNDQWDLYAFSETEYIDIDERRKTEQWWDDIRGASVLIQSNFSNTKSFELEKNLGIVQTDYIDLRQENNKTCSINLFALPGRGLFTKTKNKFTVISLDTPFLTWVPHNVTVLPTEQIIFQMAGQICILDPDTGKIGVLAYGRSPIVIPRKDIMNRGNSNK